VPGFIKRVLCCELRVAERETAVDEYRGDATCLTLDLCGTTGEGHGMVQSVALLSATLALGGCQSAGLGSNHQDIAPRWAGILFGITNACASIIGIGGIIGTGAHLSQYSCSA
jgi:hypothetical protein